MLRPSTQRTDTRFLVPSPSVRRPTVSSSLPNTQSLSRPSSPMISCCGLWTLDMGRVSRPHKDTWLAMDGRVVTGCVCACWPTSPSITPHNGGDRHLVDPHLCAPNFFHSGTPSATQSTLDAPCTHARFNSARLSAGQSFSIKVTDDSRRTLALPLLHTVALNPHVS
jgi:hypothetical protein